MNQWQLITNTKERTCCVCGRDYKKVCIVKLDKEYFKCTECVLSESDKQIEKDPLSGVYTFTDGTISMTEYNDMLDSVDMSAFDIEEFD